jgi:hypothetical protein
LSFLIGLFESFLKFEKQSQKHHHSHITCMLALVASLAAPDESIKDPSIDMSTPTEIPSVIGRSFRH